MRRVFMLLGVIALAAPAWADDAPPARLSDVTGSESVVWSEAAVSEDVGMLEEPSPIAALRFFTNQDEFKRAAEAAGKRLKCSEDFEGSNLPPNSVIGFADPLCGGVPNGPYPVGLACRNLCVQSNLGGGNPPQPNPRGPNGLAAASAGFLGACSDIVLANTFVDSLDLIFSPDPDCECKTAIGGNTLDALGNQQGVDIRVYDPANNPLGQQNFPANICGTNFFGVISDDACIGRINVFSPGGGAEGLDNVSMWCRSDEKTCIYKLKKSKSKGGCRECPEVGTCTYDSGDACPNGIGGCAKKIKRKIPCPNQGPGTCTIAGKKCDCR